MSRVLTGAGVSLALAVVVALATLAPAKQANAVCTGRSSLTGYWFDGWGISNVGGTAGGVYAQIENQDTVTTTGTGTTAWI